MSALHLLREMRALIETPDRYFVPALGEKSAKTKDGEPCGWRNKQAYVFSLCGAWQRVGDREFDVLAALGKVYGKGNATMHFLGRLPHDKIIALIDQAIANESDPS